MRKCLVFVEEEIVVEPKSLPTYLGDLIESQNHGSFRLAYVYYLEMEHESMELFPAVAMTTSLAAPVLTTDKRALIKVWETLPPKRSKIKKCLGYINKQLGVVYLIIGSNDNYLKEHSVLQALFSKVELESRVSRAEKRHGDKEFVWAQEFSSESNISKEEFLDIIREATKEVGVEIPT